MARRIVKNPVPPWLTGRGYTFSKQKPNRPWIKLDGSLMQETLFRDGLTESAQICLLCMAVEAGDKAGREWFTFHHKQAAGYHIKPATLRRNIKELVDKGFLAVRRPNTGWKSDTFSPNEYMIITKWKDP